MKSSLITAVLKCPCGRAMHRFCGRGIGEEGFGQQRECTDCQRKSSGNKVGTSSSPMEVNPEDGEQEKVREQARREEAPAGGKGPLRTGTQKKRPQVGAGGSTTATAKKGKKSNPQAEVGKKKLTMGQRLQIIREIKEGKQKSKAAQEYGVGTSYITKLMKPENIAALEKRRELDLSQDANRAVAPAELELQAVVKGIENLGVDGTSSEQEDDDSGGKPVSCITSPLTEAEAHSCFEKLRAYLYANGRNGEFSETLYLLSKSVHSFTHETQEKRRAKRGGEI